MITVAMGCDLAHFEDPLDLLLALVRRNQYPLVALPIAEITRQYNAYLRKVEQLDVQLGGDFIETASWLVLLKSRSLLPQAVGEMAPNEEMERALLDHQILAKTVGLLRSPSDAAGLGPGTALPSTEAGSPLPVATMVPAQPTVQDALLAARRALARAKAHAQGSNSLEHGSYSVAEILAQLDRRLEALEPGRGVSTEEWFAERTEPEAQVALFLALLELARLQKFCSRKGRHLALYCSSG